MNSFYRTATKSQLEMARDIDKYLKDNRKIPSHYCLFVSDGLYIVGAILSKEIGDSYKVAPFSVLFIKGVSDMLSSSMIVNKINIISVVQSTREEAIDVFKELHPEFSDDNEIRINQIYIEDKLQDAMKKLGVSSYISKGKITISIVDMFRILNVRTMLPDRFMKLKGDEREEEEKQRAEKILEKARFKGNSYRG